MIEWKDIKELTLLDRNPRTITKDQFKKLCDSIEQDPLFFEARPCLVNMVEDKLIVYAGNQRVKAAKKLGWTRIPCSIEKDIDLKVLQSRIIKDNKTYGQFDDDILAADFELDMLLDCGFMEQELGISPESVEDIDSPSKPEKAAKTCPHCNGIL